MTIELPAAQSSLFFDEPYLRVPFALKDQRKTKLTLQNDQLSCSLYGGRIRLLKPFKATLARSDLGNALVLILQQLNAKKEEETLVFATNPIGEGVAASAMRPWTKSTQLQVYQEPVPTLPSSTFYALLGRIRGAMKELGEEDWGLISGEHHYQEDPEALEGLAQHQKKQHIPLSRFEMPKAVALGVPVALWLVIGFVAGFRLNPDKLLGIALFVLAIHSPLLYFALGLLSQVEISLRDKAVLVSHFPFFWRSQRFDGAEFATVYCTENKVNTSHKRNPQKRYELRALTWQGQSLLLATLYRRKPPQSLLAAELYLRRGLAIAPIPFAGGLCRPVLSDDAGQRLISQPDPGHVFPGLGLTPCEALPELPLSQLEPRKDFLEHLGEEESQREQGELLKGLSWDGDGLYLDGEPMDYSTLAIQVSRSSELSQPKWWQKIAGSSESREALIIEIRGTEYAFYALGPKETLVGLATLNRTPEHELSWEHALALLRTAQLGGAHIIVG